MIDPHWHGFHAMFVLEPFCANRQRLGDSVCIGENEIIVYNIGCFKNRISGGACMAEKTFKQVCECENCGNEAEMVITCSLEDETTVKATPRIVAKGEGSTSGHAVCSHCGGEADIWLDV
jgi:hypothetical protein